MSDHSTRSQRDHHEESFFADRPWNQHQLYKERLGASNLRRFLQQLLDEHIERELPKVREEMRVLLGKVEGELSDLGHERPTSMHIRMFLSRFAMRFHTVTAAALRGDYHATDAPFFARPSGDRQYIRLRAFVHNANTCFANEMRLYGATFKVGHTPPSVENADRESSSDPSEAAPTDAYAHLRQDQQVMSEADVNGFVMEVCPLPHLPVELPLTAPDLSENERSRAAGSLQSRPPDRAVSYAIGSVEVVCFRAFVAPNPQHPELHRRRSGLPECG